MVLFLNTMNYFIINELFHNCSHRFHVVHEHNKYTWRDSNTVRVHKQHYCQTPTFMKTVTNYYSYFLNELLSLSHNLLPFFFFYFKFEEVFKGESQVLLLPGSTSSTSSSICNSFVQDIFLSQKLDWLLLLLLNYLQMDSCCNWPICLL